MKKIEAIIKPFKLDEVKEALHEAALSRFRPIFLTSLTTVAGLTPLLFETSFQAQVLQPMAITMVFGIGIATFIVLIVLPALLGILDDAHRNLPKLRPWLAKEFRNARGAVATRLSAPKGGA